MIAKKEGRLVNVNVAHKMQCGVVRMIICDPIQCCPFHMVPSLYMHRLAY